MKRIRAAGILLWMTAGLLSAQKADVLGAHENYGHGCRACHARHIQPEQRKRVGAIADRGAMLWGDEASMVPESADAKESPSAPEREGMLVCLSCHDGNYAPPAMMKNLTYEPVPKGYGAEHGPPTLADKPGVTTGVDLDAHPVGVTARLGCGGARGWDCTLADDGITMGGKGSARFASTYGFFVKPRRSGNGAVVVCTTCHNPHLMSMVNVHGSSVSTRYPSGTYATRYFLRAPYWAGDTAESGNHAAQFCRECHADKSNEMNGSKGRQAR